MNHHWSVTNRHACCFHCRVRSSFFTYSSFSFPLDPRLKTGDSFWFFHQSFRKLMDFS